jgi:hypothetical protein
MPKNINTGSSELRSAINSGNTAELITANSTALSVAKGVSILNGGANLTGLSLAAPTASMEGFEKVITNIAAFTGALVVSGMARAAADSFVVAVAGDTVVGPSLVLKAVNVTPTATTKSMKWIVKSSLGVTVS